jgi:hypothetical protein
VALKSGQITPSAIVLLYLAYTTFSRLTYRGLDRFSYNRFGDALASFLHRAALIGELK